MPTILGLIGTFERVRQSYGALFQSGLRGISDGLEPIHRLTRTRWPIGLYAPAWNWLNITDRSRRYVAGGLVIALHFAAIWILATSLRFAHLGDQISDVEVELLSPLAGGSEATRLLMQPTFMQPQGVSVIPPQIEIEDAPQPLAAATAIDMSQVLPPRPDPLHVNAPPELPAQFKSLGRTVSAVMKVFVLADGSISDAQVTHSSGNVALDAVALAYVKDHWRFISASIHGRVIPDWTTVFVPFKAA